MANKRGGAQPGAGRPEGTTKPETVEVRFRHDKKKVLAAKLRPDFKEKLKETINKLADEAE